MKKHIHQLYYTLITLLSIISLNFTNNHTNKLSYKNTTNISAKIQLLTTVEISGLLLGELLDCVCRQRATTVQSKK